MTLGADQVRRKIVEILTAKDAMSLQLDASALVDDALFTDDLALDSIQLLEFGIALEESFGIPISSDQFESPLNTFGALVTYIAQHATAAA